MCFRGSFTDVSLSSITFATNVPLKEPALHAGSLFFKDLDISFTQQDIGAEDTLFFSHIDCTSVGHHSNKLGMKHKSIHTFSRN